MEYEFQLDPATGNTRAIFSFEHQILGPWLEIEVGKDVDKFTELLNTLDAIQHKQINDTVISGKEYSVIIDQQDVVIKANITMGDNARETAEMSEALIEQGLDIDDNAEAMCGLEDFRELLISWSQFLKR